MRRSAVVRTQEIACAKCHWSVDERAVPELDRRDPGRLGLGECAVHLAGPGQLALARLEGRRCDRQLARVQDDLALESKPTGPGGRHGAALVIVELEIGAVHRALLPRGA